jgi:hypothetical protein
MANNYLQFSESLDDLTPEEVTWLGHQLEDIFVYGEEEYAQDDDAYQPKDTAADWEGPRCLRDYPNYEDGGGLEFSYEFLSDENSRLKRLWIYTEESGTVEHVAHLVEKFLKRFRPNTYWSLTWACTCSKMRIGEFDGGCVFVTAEGSTWNNSDLFLCNMRPKFEAEHPTPL